MSLRQPDLPRRFLNNLNTLCVRGVRSQETVARIGKSVKVLCADQRVVPSIIGNDCAQLIGFQLKVFDIDLRPDLCAQFLRFFNGRAVRTAWDEAAADRPTPDPAR